MVTRTELAQFLQETFQYQNFQDYCHNGLQVEGKDAIEKIAFGVSFNRPFLEQAIAAGADAMIVHHGIFGKEFFRLHGVLKHKVQLMLAHEMSLFGIHLPMDAHAALGNNAQLFAYLGAEITEEHEVGFIGNNTQGHTLEQMLDIFADRLLPTGFQAGTMPTSTPTAVLLPQQRRGFLYYANGPAAPDTLAIISGSAIRHYRAGALQELGVDTFICGSVDETVAAVSYETGTNFLNIGHYWSEKAGPMALQTAVEQQFAVETVFLEVVNAV